MTPHNRKRLRIKPSSGEKENVSEKVRKRKETHTPKQRALMGVAQRVELCPVKQKATGRIPGQDTGRVAVLVPSWGSAQRSTFLSHTDVSVSALLPPFHLSKNK